MVLAFKKQFIHPIKTGDKIHTIREDKHNRWKAGNSIQAATGVRTKAYNKFFDSECVSTQKFEIKTVKSQAFPSYQYLMPDGRKVIVLVEDRFINMSKVEVLAMNDGFNGLDDFFEWFDQDFKGKIIHWTNYKY